MTRVSKSTQPKSKRLSLELEQVRNEAVAKIDDLVVEVEKGTVQSRNIQTNRAHLVEQFNTHVRYLHGCGNELLSIYRQANMAGRSTNPPKHFGNNG